MALIEVEQLCFTPQEYDRGRMVNAKIECHINILSGCRLPQKYYQPNFVSRTHSEESIFVVSYPQVNHSVTFLVSYRKHVQDVLDYLKLLVRQYDVDQNSNSIVDRRLIGLSYCENLGNAIKLISCIYTLLSLNLDYIVYEF